MSKCFKLGQCIKCNARNLKVASKIRCIGAINSYKWLNKLGGDTPNNNKDFLNGP